MDQNESVTVLPNPGWNPLMAKPGYSSMPLRTLYQPGPQLIQHTGRSNARAISSSSSSKRSEEPTLPASALEPKRIALRDG